MWSLLLGSLIDLLWDTFKLFTKSGFCKEYYYSHMKLIGFINSFKIIPKWFIVKSIEKGYTNLYER